MSAHVRKVRVFSLIAVALVYCLSVPSLLALYKAADCLFKNTAGTYNLVNKSSNAFITLDLRLLEWLSTGLTDNLQLLSTSFSLIIFISGLAALLALALQRHETNLLESLSLLLLVPLTLLAITGTDSVILALLAWIPLMTALLQIYLMQNKSQSLLFILILLICLVMTMHLQQFAGLPLTISWLWARWAKLDHLPAFPVLRIRQDYILLLLTFLPALILMFTADSIPVPEYSHLGHVVPDDGLPGNALPLLGPTPAIPLIDRAYLRLEYATLIFGLFFLSLAAVQLNKSHLTRAVAGLAGLLLLDACIAEKYSVIAPLAVAFRTIPWLIYLSYLPLLSALLGVLLFFCLRGNARQIYCLLALLLTIWGEPGLKTGELYQLAYRSNAERPLEELKATVSPELQAYYAKWIVSPSYALYREVGIWPLFIDANLHRRNFRSIANYNAEVNASRNASPVELEKMLDRNPNSRWSTSPVRQMGDEWIQIYFPEPLDLVAVDLETGPFFTDFHRGISIAYKSSCPPLNTKAVTDFSDYQELVSHNPWDGALRSTDLGYTYFGSQGDGRIYFPQTAHVNCLLVRQTGSSPIFDWSISEIEVLKAAKK